MRSITTVALSLLLASPLAAQATDRGGFVVRLGTDTVAVERFSRAGDVLTVDQVVHVPVTMIRHFTLTTDGQGRAKAFTYESHRPTGAAPATKGEITFGADSATVHMVSGARDATIRVAAPGAFPFVGSSFAAIEPLLMRARRAGGGSFAGSVLPVVGSPPLAVPVTWVGRDSVTFAIGNPDLFRARVDARGRILAVSGAATTQKIDVVRVSDVDVAAVAAGWARKDSAGATMGALSPGDTVVAEAGGAKLRIVYSRPALRGRQLMGFLIPYGSVWRTGANAATTFTTSADLVMNGTTIPAGSYTLWTIATPQGAQLAINKQTGQWGTAYDDRQDLVRVPLTVTTTTTPVERFTMMVEPGDAGGTLAYVWGDRRFAVPFTVKK